jgi:hypothetical protein
MTWSKQSVRTFTLEPSWCEVPTWNRSASMCLCKNLKWIGAVLWFDFDLKTQHLLLSFIIILMPLLIITCPACLCCKLIVVSACASICSVRCLTCKQSNWQCAWQTRDSGSTVCWLKESSDCLYWQNVILIPIVWVSVEWLDMTEFWKGMGCFFVSAMFIMCMGPCNLLQDMLGGFWLD